MAIMNWLRGSRAAVQSGGGGDVITNSEELVTAIRQASMGSSAGMPVTPDTSMQVATVYACVRIISGAVANMPVHVNRKVDANTREDVSGDPQWAVFSGKPNGWQKPAQFKRMMQAHLLLRGNAYAQIVRSRGRVVALNPLQPDRMAVKQNNSLDLEYEYTRNDGRRVRMGPEEVMHLVGLTLDGVTGVSAITYARETIGLSMAQERHGATTFKNSARPSSVLTHPGKLGPEGADNLRASMDAYRQGGESEGKTLILEEGMNVSPMSMTAEDAQWIESRKFSRTDIAMFFGVPPHMIGDTEKSTSWGTGIEQQGIGFVTYTLEDYLTTWEETLTLDLIDSPGIYARFNRKSLIRGDLKTRWESYVKALQWGVYSPDKILALEDENPRADGGGGVYYDPPNTAGGTEGEGNEPENTPKD